MIYRPGQIYTDREMIIPESEDNKIAQRLIELTDGTLPLFRLTVLLATLYFSGLTPKEGELTYEFHHIP